jgi:hypothetical protein
MADARADDAMDVDVGVEPLGPRSAVGDVPSYTVHRAAVGGLSLSVHQTDQARLWLHHAAFRPTVEGAATRRGAVVVHPIAQAALWLRSGYGVPVLTAVQDGGHGFKRGTTGVARYMPPRNSHGAVRVSRRVPFVIKIDNTGWDSRATTVTVVPSQDGIAGWADGDLASVDGAGDGAKVDSPTTRAPARASLRVADRCARSPPTDRGRHCSHARSR